MGDVSNALTEQPQEGEPCSLTLLEGTTNTFLPFYSPPSPDPHQ